MNLYQIIYATLSFRSINSSNGADSISKLMQQKMGKDRWNEEESFDQNQELIKSNQYQYSLFIQI